MKNKSHILQLIKKSVHALEPDATLILYGSYARGDNNENSDIDILVLLNRDNLTRIDQKKIKYPLYEIEFENGTIISPLVFSKKEWTIKHSITPLYNNIKKEGKVL